MSEAMAYIRFTATESMQSFKCSVGQTFYHFKTSGKILVLPAQKANDLIESFRDNFAEVTEDEYQASKMPPTSEPDPDGDGDGDGDPDADSDGDPDDGDDESTKALESPQNKQMTSDQNKAAPKRKKRSKRK